MISVDGFLFLFCVVLQLKVAKEKMAMLIGKSDNDDRLINALRLEIEAQKQV
jgi:hypothetical protein